MASRLVNVCTLALLVPALWAQSSQNCVSQDDFDHAFGSLERLVQQERLARETQVRDLQEHNQQLEVELSLLREKSRLLVNQLASLKTTNDAKNGNPDNDLDTGLETMSGTAKKRFASVQSEQAFTAVIDSTTPQPLSAGQTVRFDKLISNYGNSFDIHHNKFTAKYGGRYVFSLTVLSRPNETLRLDVVKDGAEVFHVYATGNEYNAASKTVVVYVAAGSSVWVRSSRDFDNTVHGYGHTSFTGFLLYSS